MQDVIDSAEKKADYTEFDKVVDALDAWLIGCISRDQRTVISVE